MTWPADVEQREGRILRQGNTNRRRVQILSGAGHEEMPASRFHSANQGDWVQSGCAGRDGSSSATGICPGHWGWSVDCGWTRRCPHNSPDHSEKLLFMTALIDTRMGN